MPSMTTAPKDLLLRLRGFALALLLKEQCLGAVTRQQQLIIPEVARERKTLVDAGLRLPVLAAESGGGAGALECSTPRPGASLPA